MAEPVSDLKSCEAWLARAALADPRQACITLTALLESLQDNPPADLAYMEILERLREPIVVALGERSKKFSARPLPLSEAEQEAFVQVLDLWRSLGAAYRSLLTALNQDPAGHPDLKGKEALLAQRGLDCIVDLMLNHYRCRHELDPDLWQELHGLYAMVSASGHARDTVPVGRKSKSVSSPAEVYARALLLAIANPYTLSVRELTWARRWSAKWAYKVEFSQGGKDCYAVDPTAGSPPAWHANAPAKALSLDAAEIRRSIRSRLKKIEAGEDPESLGLGNDCILPDCARLLQTLSKAWSEQPTARQFSRRATPGAADLSTGFEAIHVAITARVFKDTPQQWSYARKHDTEALYSYHGADRSANAASVAPGAERWEILDESATGFRLRRATNGERLSQQQLVALRPEDGKHFFLCDIRWLMTGIDGALIIGLAVLPGVAQGVAMRPVLGPNQTPQAYTQSFLLPQTGTQAASLILPTGSFQPERIVELRIEEQLKRARLRDQVQRGFDYERVTFEFIAAS